MLQITKNDNAASSFSGAFLHSDNDLFSKNYSSTVFEHLKNWYKCKKKTGFMFDTIQNANATCQKMNSTIQTFLTQVHVFSKIFRHFVINACCYDASLAHLTLILEFVGPSPSVNSEKIQNHHW